MTTFLEPKHFEVIDNSLLPNRDRIQTERRISREENLKQVKCGKSVESVKRVIRVRSVESVERVKRVCSVEYVKYVKHLPIVLLAFLRKVPVHKSSKLAQLGFWIFFLQVLNSECLTPEPTFYLVPSTFNLLPVRVLDCSAFYPLPSTTCSIVVL
jgi:hypothetical protein